MCGSSPRLHMVCGCMRPGADAVDVCVHAGYAYEIQTSLGGWGMELLLGGRQYALNGVLNGIDYAEWDPATDSHLPANYSVEDLPDLKGKAACKRAMQVRSRAAGSPPPGLWPRGPTWLPQHHVLLLLSVYLVRVRCMAAAAARSVTQAAASRSVPRCHRAGGGAGGAGAAGQP